MGSDYEIFHDKKLSDLFKDIYKNSTNNKKNIRKLVSSLSTFIDTPENAITLFPYVNDLLEVDVKNDEQLVKLAKVVQQLISHSTSGTEDEVISGDERQKILNKMRKEAKKLDENNISLKSQIDEISNKAQTPEA